MGKVAATVTVLSNLAMQWLSETETSGVKHTADATGLCQPLSFLYKVIVDKNEEGKLDYFLKTT